MRIGLATATIDGYNSSQVPMYPPLASFGLSDSREVFFPLRSSADVYKHQGHTEISNSPLSIIKLTEPAMLMMNFESESAKLQYGELTVHVPYIVDNPNPPIIKPEGPTAYISSRPLIVGSSSQSGGGGGGLGSSQFLPLPVPKINLNASIVALDVYDRNNNGVWGTQASLNGFPTLINMDFTSEHFSNPENRIFIEMVHYRKKSRNFRLGYGYFWKGAGYKIPTKNIANVGQDTNLPWSTGNSTPNGGFWNRTGNNYWLPSSGILLGVDRNNHYEVYGYTLSTYPIWEYFHNRFEFTDVNYRDITGNTASYLNMLVPSTSKRDRGKNEATNRFAYSPWYTPYYCAFRYIQWIPSANGGKGQIVSGPLSKIIKITNRFHPFQPNYVQSALVGKPVSEINSMWYTYYNYLKCSWESNVP